MWRRTRSAARPAMLNKVVLTVELGPWEGTQFSAPAVKDRDSLRFDLLSVIYIAVEYLLQTFFSISFFASTAITGYHKY